MRGLKFLLLLSVAVPVAAHDPPSDRAETTELRVDLDAGRIAAPFDGGTLRVTFGPAAGAIRARLAFVGVPAPRAARLRVPLPGGGHLDVPFRRTGAGFVSMRPLNKLVDGTIVELDEGGRIHRLILRSAR